MLGGMVGGSESVFRGWVGDFFGFAFEVWQVLPSAAVIRNSRITELLVTSSPTLSRGRIRLTFRLICVNYPDFAGGFRLTFRVIFGSLDDPKAHTKGFASPLVAQGPVC